MRHTFVFPRIIEWYSIFCIHHAKREGRQTQIEKKTNIHFNWKQISYTEAYIRCISIAKACCGNGQWIQWRMLVVFFRCWIHFHYFQHEWWMTIEWAEQTCNNMFESTGSYVQIYFEILMMKCVKINNEKSCFHIVYWLVQRQMFDKTVFLLNVQNNRKYEKNAIIHIEECIF